DGLVPSKPSGSGGTPAKLGTSEMFATRSERAGEMLSVALLLSLAVSDCAVVVPMVAVFCRFRPAGGEVIHLGLTTAVTVSVSPAANAPTAQETRSLAAGKVNVSLLGARDS